MQICFVCSEYPPGPHGGGGTFTQVLSRALVTAGHDVRVIGIYKPSYPSPDYEDDHGVQVWRLRQPKTRFGWVGGRMKLFRQISTWAKQDLIDLVEVPDWQGWAAGWPRLSVPVVVRLNGSASYFARELDTKLRRTTFWIERAAMRRADHWCSVSQYTADRTREVFGLDSDPSAILHNPVETRSHSLGVKRSSVDVVFTGTLTDKKGVFSLLRSWPQVLQNTYGTARLHLYGKDGRTEQGDSVREVLISMLTAAQQESVIFHGHVDRDALFHALSAARLAVFPSYAEAFAIAPLEAMATGCPTICSHRGSGRELVDHAKNGLLIDPENPSEIATAITELIQNDTLAQRLGQAGKKLIESRFTDQTLLQQNIAFYQRCLGVVEPQLGENKAEKYPCLQDTTNHTPMMKT